MTQILICLSLTHKASFINALCELEFAFTHFFWKAILALPQAILLARVKTGKMPKREFKAKTGKTGKREFKAKTGNLGKREFKSKTQNLPTQRAQKQKREFNSR